MIYNLYYYGSNEFGDGRIRIDKFKNNVYDNFEFVIIKKIKTFCDKGIITTISSSKIRSVYFPTIEYLYEILGNNWIIVPENIDKYIDSKILYIKE